jgi:hypothetical protein
MLTKTTDEIYITDPNRPSARICHTRISWRFLGILIFRSTAPGHY